MWESHSFGAEDKMIHSFSVLSDFGEESGLSWATWQLQEEELS